MGNLDKLASKMAQKTNGPKALQAQVQQPGQKNVPTGAVKRFNSQVGQGAAGQ